MQIFNNALAYIPEGDTLGKQPSIAAQKLLACTGKLCNRDTALWNPIGIWLGIMSAEKAHLLPLIIWQGGEQLLRSPEGRFHSRALQPNCFLILPDRSLQQSAGTGSLS